MSEPRFRFTPQAGVVILLTMAALFLPILGVILFAQGYFARPEPEPTEVVSSPVLRQSLERAAEVQLTVAPIEDERRVLAVPATDANRAEKFTVLKSAVEKSAATMIELGEGQYLVSGPVGTHAAVSLALLGSASGEKTGEETELFEVRFSP